MNSFKNIAKDELPRERLFLYGSEKLSNEELLAIILKTGSRKYNVKELSLNLLSYIGNIKKLREIGINSLISLEGIGKVKAIELKAAIELGRRVYEEKLDISNIKLNDPKVIYNYFYQELACMKQEYFYVLYLDTKGKLISKKCLFVGTINTSIIHPREIFKEAYLVSANSIICVHNHPSGDVNPSKEDIMVTRKIKEIGIIHGINLIDHIIIGKDNYYSFYMNKQLI